jgi:error-prone DNA polymerase
MTEYVELHSHSYYSLLDGASSPADLVQRAAKLNMPALALTDHDAVYGAVPFVEAARKAGIRPILGAELTLTGGPHLTLLAADDRGWRNLTRLISIARHSASKGEAELPPDAVEAYHDGLIALSGCRNGLISRALLGGDHAAALDAAKRCLAVFGPERFWIELQHHLLPEDDRLVAALVALANTLGVGYVATGNAHYATRDAHRLQDVLVGIRHLTPLHSAGRLLRPNSEYFLKSGRQMAAVFARYPQAITNTNRIADCCSFDFKYGLQELPVFPTPQGLDATGYLHDLCRNAIPHKYPHSRAAAIRQLDHELDVITRAGLANYFLIVWDIVRFARQSGIRCQGRGSAANSVVAYLLDISPIDPLAHNLVFERFLSAERQTVPDIDIDFQADRREEVIQYVYRRYGHEYAAMACTLITFRARSAVRDVGKVLGLPPHVIDLAARAFDTRHPKDLADNPGFKDVLQDRAIAQPWEQLIDLCDQIDSLPRHLGIHNGGMVITGAPLVERIPTEPATMEDRVVVQWDKEALETAGLVKIDILGLRMLSAITEALSTIERLNGTRPDFDQCTYDDPAIYSLIASGDTVGCFQVESRAQAQMLPRMKPRCFADLVVAISLIRPGPIQGDMVHPYLRRRLDEEPVSYPHPLLEPVLHETLGVILFQEQVLQVSEALAGFTPGQGELLRRALGSKQGAAAVEVFRQAFMQGSQAKGVPAEVAADVFDRLKAFGLYSFPRSHAASFAVIVYQSAWLKCYYPAPFYAALLNNQPMGFWSPAVLVNDARRHGLEVLSVDVNRSQETCTVEDGAIRLGLARVKGMGEHGSDRVVLARAEKPFTRLIEFCHRTRLPRGLVENLIQAGALDCWGISRRQLIWKLGELHYEPDELGLVFPAEDVALPDLSAGEQSGMEYSMLGLSTGDHPMSFYREWLREHEILDSRALVACRNGQRVRAAGMLVVHQAPPTAKGMHFLTLEDEGGFTNVVVRPHVYERFRREIRGAAFLLVQGMVEQKDGVSNLVAVRFAPLEVLAPAGGR